MCAVVVMVVVVVLGAVVTYVGVDSGGGGECRDVLWWVFVVGDCGGVCGCL